MPDIRERFGAFDRLVMPDLWDDAQHREPRPAKGSDHERARKAIVIVTALALTVVTTGVMIRAFNHGDDAAPVTGTPAEWPTGSVDHLGLSFRYPPQWRLQPFAEEIGTIYFQGVLVSNTDLTFRHPTPSDGGATSAWDLSALPSDGVVISIEQIGGGPAPGPGPVPADTPLPLSLADATLLTPQPDPFGFSPKPQGTEERYLEFVLKGEGDAVRVFFGPDASEGDRAAAADVIASIGSSEAQASVAPPTKLTPPGFTPAEGWFTEETSADPAVFEAPSPPTTWAADVPFDPADLHPVDASGKMTQGTWPSRTIRSLPSDGVVIVASFPWSGPASPGPGKFPGKTLPLTLRDASIQLHWEGQVAPNVPQYLVLASVDGRPIDVRLFFGSLRPSQAMLSTAQEELSRLSVPPNLGG